MAKFPNIPTTNSGYWCDPRKCLNCDDYYDYCQCNQDNASEKHCEECIDNGLAPDWKGIVKKSTEDKYGRMVR